MSEHPPLIILLGQGFGLALPEGTHYEDIEFVSIRFKQKSHTGMCDFAGQLLYLKNNE